MRSCGLLNSAVSVNDLFDLWHAFNPLSHLTPFPLLECREIIKNMIYHAYKIRKGKMSKIRKT